MRKIKLPISKIISEYNSGLSSLELAKKYNVSKKVILDRLRKAHIDRRSISASKRKYSLNEDYFENIDTEEKAYWLGFLLADGNISYSGRYNKGRHLRIALQNKDKNHLEKMKFSLKSNYNLKLDKNNCFWLCFNSLKLTKDLENLGWFDFKKNGNTRILESVNITLRKHLIRGLIDGDGWIFDAKRRWILGFVDLHKSTVDWFHEYIQSIGFGKKTKVKKCLKANAWKVAYSNKKVPDLLKHFYEKSKINLDRKYDLFLLSQNTKPIPKKLGSEIISEDDLNKIL